MSSGHFPTEIKLLCVRNVVASDRNAKYLCFLHAVPVCRWVGLAPQAAVLPEGSNKEPETQTNKLIKPPKRIPGVFNYGQSS